MNCRTSPVLLFCRPPARSNRWFLRSDPQVTRYEAAPMLRIILDQQHLRATLIALGDS
jgi:hypothetical protein